MSLYNFSEMIAPLLLVMTTKMYMCITCSAHCLAAHGRPEQALASLVQLGEDDVLGLVGRGLCREVDHDWLVNFLWKLVQNEILPEKIHDKITTPQLCTCTQVKSHILL